MYAGIRVSNVRILNIYPLTLYWVLEYLLYLLWLNLTEPCMQWTIPYLSILLILFNRSSFALWFVSLCKTSPILILFSLKIFFYGWISPCFSPQALVDCSFIDSPTLSVYKNFQQICLQCGYVSILTQPQWIKNFLQKLEIFIFVKCFEIVCEVAMIVEWK